MTYTTNNQPEVYVTLTERIDRKPCFVSFTFPDISSSLSNLNNVFYMYLKLEIIQQYVNSLDDESIKTAIFFTMYNLTPIIGTYKTVMAFNYTWEFFNLLKINRHNSYQALLQSNK